MNDTIVGFLLMLALGIFGFFRNKRIKKEHPEKVDQVNRTLRTLPKRMHVTDFKDETMNKYNNGKTFIVYGIIAILALITIILSKL